MKNKRGSMAVRFLSMIIFILLCATKIIGAESPLSAVPDAQSYMHDAELMNLVHGNVKGTVLWVWDTCCVQHAYFSLMCAATLVGITIYEASSMVHERVNSIIAKILHKFGKNKIPLRDTECIQTCSQNAQLVPKTMRVLALKII